MPRSEARWSVAAALMLAHVALGGADSTGEPYAWLDQSPVLRVSAENDDGLAVFEVPRWQLRLDGDSRTWELAAPIELLNWQDDKIGDLLEARLIYTCPGELTALVKVVAGTAHTVFRVEVADMSLAPAPGATPWGWAAGWAHVWGTGGGAVLIDDADAPGSGLMRATYNDGEEVLFPFYSILYMSAPGGTISVWTHYTGPYYAGPPASLGGVFAFRVTPGDTVRLALDHVAYDTVGPCVVESLEPLPR